MLANRVDSYRMGSFEFFYTNIQQYSTMFRMPRDLTLDFAGPQTQSTFHKNAPPDSHIFVLPDYFSGFGPPTCRLFVKT
jgi:hypothetical protein